MSKFALIVEYLNSINLSLFVQILLAFIQISIALWSYGKSVGWSYSSLVSLLSLCWLVFINNLVWFFVWGFQQYEFKTVRGQIDNRLKMLELELSSIKKILNELVSKLSDNSVSVVQNISSLPKNNPGSSGGGWGNFFSSVSESLCSFFGNTGSLAYSYLDSPVIKTAVTLAVVCVVVSQLPIVKSCFAAMGSLYSGFSSTVAKFSPEKPVELPRIPENIPHLSLEGNIEVGLSMIKEAEQRGLLSSNSNSLPLSESSERTAKELARLVSEICD